MTQGSHLTTLPHWAQSLIKTAHTVQLRAADPSLFSFPPSNEPQTLPPPPAGSSLDAPPFTIPASIYNAALDVRIPITIACVYAVSVTLLNRYNRSHGNKPWAISKTKAFFWFVVAHNVFLAVYSGWTFWGFFKALQRTVYNPRGPDGLAGTVDSLCKMHGIPGLSNAIEYNPNYSAWISESPGKVLLTDMGTPDPTDLGRLWNEGLAFYGWFFYLSKFYEVLDTVIIILKGKRSSTLQTYHHAGAMMCMWAGIRFMSPPIWMFVFVNSGIHAMMYTYYTLTAFSVPIHRRIKRALTSMQIMQFLVGATYASLHSFISYTVPVQVRDQVSSKATSSVASAASAATTTLGSVLKKILLRAAGEEGIAENVAGANPIPTHRAAHHGWHHGSHSADATYHTEYQNVPCVTTSGQTFAIWLNVLYLTPLTFLFVRFFVKSYIRRSNKTTGHETKHARFEKAGEDALHGIEREIDEDQTVSREAHRENAKGEAKNKGQSKDNSDSKGNGNGNGNDNTQGEDESKGSSNGNGKKNKKGKSKNKDSANSKENDKDTSNSEEHNYASYSEAVKEGSSTKTVMKDVVLEGGDAIMKTT